MFDFLSSSCLRLLLQENYLAVELRRMLMSRFVLLYSHLLYVHSLHMAKYRMSATYTEIISTLSFKTTGGCIISVQCVGAIFSPILLSPLNPPDHAMRAGISRFLFDLPILTSHC